MTSPSTRRAIAPLRACGVAFALLLGSGAQAGVHCIPMFDCPGGYAGLDAKRTELGWHVIWFVRETDGTVTDRGFSCKHGSCLTAAAFADLVEKTKRAGDPSQSAREAFATQIPRWQALRASEPALFAERVRFVAETKPAATALLAATSALPAGAPVYTHTVKANGANATRPAYDVVGGTRGAREVANAGVGQPCKLPLLLPASGGDGWGEFGPEFTPNRVTLCAPK